MSNFITNMALKSLVKFMTEKNIKCLKAFVTPAGEIDFIPVFEPDDLILKSEHEAKINELKNYLKTITK